MIPNARLKTAIHHLAGVTLTVALVMLLWAGSWLFWPTHGFTKVDISFVDGETGAAIPPPTVAAGDNLAYRVDYCVDETTPVPVTVRRAIQLQNHVMTYGLAEVAYQISRPCESVIRVLSIPDMVRPGDYKIQIFTDIQTSPIRHVNQVWTSPSFTIAKR